MVLTALWAIPVADLGGVARHALDTAERGVPGWQLGFLCPPGPLGAELRARGAQVKEAPFGPDHGVAASARSLRQAVAETRARLVHTHLSYADIVAALAVPPRVRLVTTEHGIAADDHVYHGSTAKVRLMEGVHRLRLRRFAARIAVSAATAAAMRAKWHASAVIVIPNGIDPPASPAPRQPGLRVLSLARLAPEKRLSELLAAFAHLAEQHAEASLVLAGVGGLEHRLRAEAAALGIAERVDLPGHLDATEAMAGADVLAMLSVWENCSYSLLDAAAHGLGVVASPVGGNPEILPARCLVDPGDAAAVASALHAQGTDLAARPGLSGWPSVAEMTRRVAAVYDEVAA